MLSTRNCGGELPHDRYGFNFTNNPSEDDPDDDDDDDDDKEERLPDRVVLLKGTSYTCRFILGSYEYKGARIIGGQVFHTVWQVISNTSAGSSHSSAGILHSSVGLSHSSAGYFTDSSAGI